MKTKIFTHWTTTREVSWDPDTKCTATIYDAGAHYGWSVIRPRMYKTGHSSTQAGARAACRRWVKKNAT